MAQDPTAQHDLRNDYLTREDETAVLEQVPSVAYSSPMLQMHDRLSFGNGVVKDILVLGVAPQYRQVRNLILITRALLRRRRRGQSRQGCSSNRAFRAAEVRHLQRRQPNL